LEASKSCESCPYRDSCRVACAIIRRLLPAEFDHYIRTRPEKPLARGKPARHVHAAGGQRSGERWLSFVQDPDALPIGGPGRVHPRRPVEWKDEDIGDRGFFLRYCTIEHGRRAAPYDGFDSIEAAARLYVVDGGGPIVIPVGTPIRIEPFAIDEGELRYQYAIWYTREPDRRGAEPGFEYDHPGAEEDERRRLEEFPAVAVRLRFSPRQAELIYLLVQGAPLAEAAHAAGVSEPSARKALNRLLDRNRLPRPWTRTFRGLFSGGEEVGRNPQAPPRGSGRPPSDSLKCERKGGAR